MLKFNILMKYDVEMPTIRPTQEARKNHLIMLIKRTDSSRNISFLLIVS